MLKSAFLLPSILCNLRQWRFNQIEKLMQKNPEFLKLYFQYFTVIYGEFINYYNLCITLVVLYNCGGHVIFYKNFLT